MSVRHRHRERARFGVGHHRAREPYDPAQDRFEVPGDYRIDDWVDVPDPADPPPAPTVPLEWRNLDGFNRVVVGAATYEILQVSTATPVRYDLRDGRDMYSQSKFLWGTGSGQVVTSEVGYTVLSSTDPRNDCLGAREQYIGWKDKESWISWTPETHPGGASGIVVRVVATSGYGLCDGGYVEVVRRTSAPTASRQGTVVASVPVDGRLYDVFVPIADVPAAGNPLYLGVRTLNLANRAARLCAFEPPYQSGTAGSGRCSVAWGVSAAGLQPTSDGEASVFWTESGATVGDLGVIPPGSEAGGWWDGGNRWVLSEVSATSPSWGVDGAVLWVEDTDPAHYIAWRLYQGDKDALDSIDVDLYPVIGEQADLPAVGDAGSFRLRFRVSVVGDADPDGRFLAFGFEQSDQVVVHFGSGDYPQGLYLVADSVESSVAMTLTANTWYYVVFDTRKVGYLRAKLWPDSQVEPGGWGLVRPWSRVPADFLSVRLGAQLGNGAAPAMRLEVSAVAVLSVEPVDGQAGVFTLGIGDGLTRVFDAPFSFDVVLARAFVDGAETALDPQTDGAAGLLVFDAPPADGAVISLSLPSGAQTYPDAGGDDLAEGA